MLVSAGRAVWKIRPTAPPGAWDAPQEREHRLAVDADNR
jgi:hypothetical protein